MPELSPDQVKENAARARAVVKQMSYSEATRILKGG